MAVGRRWDIDWDQPLDFSRPGWAELIRDAARRANVQRPGNYIDYFVFSRGYVTIFCRWRSAASRGTTIFLWRARSSGAALLDISPVVLAIHQNHDYSHAPGNSSMCARVPS
jgi:hypothetical protein